MNGDPERVFLFADKQVLLHQKNIMWKKKRLSPILIKKKYENKTIRKLNKDA